MLNRRRYLHDVQESNDRVSLLETPEFGNDVDSSSISNSDASACYLAGHSATSSATTFQAPFQQPVTPNFWIAQQQTSGYQLKSRLPICNNNTYNSTGEGSSHDRFCDNISSNRIDASAIELSTNSYQRQRNSLTNEFIYYTVQPGDSLQNLSVKYSCSIAAIKRLNNLWSDQEFYGLAKIKLPVGRFRLIAEAIQPDTVPLDPGISSSKSNPQQTEFCSRSVPSGPIDRQSSSSDQYHSDEIFNLSILGQDTVWNPQQFERESSETIFKIYDKNIEKARVAAQSYDDHASAIMQSLAQSGNIVSAQVGDLSDSHKMARLEAENLLNDMSDYGLSYNGLILFIFIVCLICPLAYIIYLEETHHELTIKTH